MAPIEFTISSRTLPLLHTIYILSKKNIWFIYSVGERMRGREKEGKKEESTRKQKPPGIVYNYKKAKMLGYKPNLLPVIEPFQSDHPRTPQSIYTKI